ncbi:unnamed protein product, partial [Discosporangium mesarthrocarpum]
MSFACVVEANFHDQLKSTIGPILVMGRLACTFWIARRRNVDVAKAIGEVKENHLSVALFVSFAIYSSVSGTVFSTFACDDQLDTGMSYFRAEYTIACDQAHLPYQICAAFTIIVYPVGIPAVYLWWLLNKRELLMKCDSLPAISIEELQPFEDSLKAYNPRRLYFEVVECCRRVMLTGITVFIFPKSSAQ